MFSGEFRKPNKGRGRHGLTAQKKQEIKEAFELFDTDGSGLANFTILASLWLVSINMFSFLIPIL